MKYSDEEAGMMQYCLFEVRCKHPGTQPPATFEKLRSILNKQEKKLGSLGFSSLIKKKLGALSYSQAQFCFIIHTVNYRDVILI